MAMKTKLIVGGGDSLVEAIKNTKNKDIDVVPSRERCLYVISNADHISGIAQEAEEKDEFAKWLFTGDKGGTIILSTDSNSLKLSDSKFKNWLLQKFTTVKNRMLAKRVLDKIRRRNNVYAWTVGQYLIGTYTGSNGKTFDERSLSIDCIGVSRKMLFTLAQELCAAFKQESVLVKDASNQQIYFVTAD